MHVTIHGKVKKKRKPLLNEFRNRHARYNDIVGFTGQALYQRIAAEILAEYYEDLRLEANFFPKNNTDITVLSYNHVLLKLEVLNWWVNTYLTQERAFKIRDNLDHSPYSAICITSPLNLKPSSSRILKGIPVYYSNYQLLPSAYYEHFSQLDHRFTFFRAIYNETTIKHQKTQFQRFLKEIDII